MHKIIFVLFVCITASSAAAINFSQLQGIFHQHKTEAQLFFESINPSDREHFILYYLRKGLIEKNSALGAASDSLYPVSSSKFSQLTEPENFSVNLVDWTEEEFEMEEGDVVEMVQYSKVCLESGKCVQPSDVGSNCCLF